MAAGRSKMRNSFYRYTTGVVGSNPIHQYVVISLCVLSCVGGGPSASRSRIAAGHTAYLPGQDMLLAKITDDVLCRITSDTEEEDLVMTTAIVRDFQ
jgi:hypothetical protein